MNNYVKKWVQLPVLLMVMITISLSGCQDMANSSEEAERETSVVPIQNFANSSSNNLPDGLLPNSQQYNNSSKPVATGRSGGVTLTARAMINSQMVVDLEVTSGMLDSDEEAPGTIAKVRVKALDVENPDPDNPEWEENYNRLDDGGSFTKSYENLVRGQQLDIHANVREMFGGKKNRHRTGVISLTEDVKYRPDLEVVSINAPTEVFVSDPVNISAEISENLGDLGATADCILRIDGNEIDRVNGMWVDAGDAVLCSFLTQFGTTGVKYGEISVENVTPGDFDTGNNSKSFQINVIEPGTNDFYWSANATIDIEDYTYTYSDWYYGSYTGNEKGKRQYLWASGHTASDVGFPMDISVNITSGEHVWLNESLTSVSSAYNYYYYDYANIYLPNNTFLQVVDYNDYYYWTNNTYVYLERYARDVIYYGTNYYGGNYYYEYNDTMLPYGNDITFEVSLNGSEGSATMAGDISLSEVNNTYSYCYSYGCYSGDFNYLHGYNYGNPD